MADRTQIEHDLDRVLDDLQGIRQSDPHAIQSFGISEGLYSLVQGTRTFLLAAALLDLTQGIARELNEEKIVDRVLKNGLRLMRAEQGSVGLLKGDIIDFRIVRQGQPMQEPYRLSKDKGLTGWAIRNRTTIRTGNVLADERQYVAENYVAQMSDTVSELDVPLISGEDVLGVLNAESPRSDAFDESDEKFMEALASFASIQIQNARLFQYNMALLNTAEELSSIQNPDTLLRNVLKKGMSLVGADQGAIGLVHGDQIEFRYAIGDRADEVESFSLSISEGLTGRAVRLGEIVIVNDVSQNADYKDQIPETGAEMDVPLIFGGKVFGVLNLESRQVGAFSDREKDLMRALASIAATAIRNADAYEQASVKLRTIELQFQAAEKLALIGDVSPIIHRISNMLSLLRAYTFDIEGNAQVHASLENIAKSMRDACDQLLDEAEAFGRRYKEFGSASAIDLRSAIEKAVNSIKCPPSISIDLSGIPTEVRVRAHASQLSEVFRNLINNAVYAMPNGGDIKFTVASLTPRRVRLWVMDMGTGIPRENWERVFERDFTTKPHIDGVKIGGLGLWWVRLYLTLIGGTINIEKSEITKGTTIGLEIPLYGERE